VGGTLSRLTALLLAAAVIGTMGNKPAKKPLSIEHKMARFMALLKDEDSVDKFKAIAGDTPLTEFKDDEYNTPLRYAADHNRVKVCEFLLDSKLDINVARWVRCRKPLGNPRETNDFPCADEFLVLMKPEPKCEFAIHSPDGC